MAFAESALAAIEFPAALDLVAQHAVTALGAACVRGLTPKTDSLWIAEELARVTELAAIQGLLSAARQSFARVRRVAKDAPRVAALAAPALPQELERARVAHPLLFGGSAPVVRFDLSLEPEEHTVLVSGPNTGGKTVLVEAGEPAEAPGSSPRSAGPSVRRSV